MASSPPAPAPAGTSPDRRPGGAAPSRPVTMTDAFADVFLPRSVTRRLATNGPSNNSPRACRPVAQVPKAAKQLSNTDKPLSPNDGNSMKDKVRRWQEDCGGAAAAEDAIDTISPPAEAHQDAPSNAVKEQGQNPSKPNKRTKQRHRKEEEEPLKNSPKATPSRLDDDIPRRAKASSPATPKRRVVSDEHWVRERKKQDSAATQLLNNTREALKGRPSNAPLKNLVETWMEKLPVDDEVAPQRRPKRTRPDWKSERSEVVVGENAGRFGADDSPSTPSRRKPPKPPSPVSAPQGIEGWLRSQRTPSPVASGPSLRHSNGSASPKAAGAESTVERREAPRHKSKRCGKRSHRKVQRGSPDPEKSEQGPPPKATAAKVDPRQGKSVEERQAAPDLAPVPVPRKPGDRIEAWLDNTPDPFVDVQTGPDPSAVNVCRGPPEEGLPDNTPSRNSAKVESKRSGPAKARVNAEKASKGPGEKSPRLHVSFDVPSPPFAGADRNASNDVADGSNPDRQHTGSPTSPIKRGGRARKRPANSAVVKSLSATEESFAENSDVPPALAVDTPSKDPTQMAIAPPDGHDVKPRDERSRAPENWGADVVRKQAETMSPEEPEPAPAVQGRETGDISLEACWARCPPPQNAPMDNQLRRLDGRMEPSEGSIASCTDLASMVSLQSTASGRLKPARSVRALRSNLANPTITDLMRELSEDESRYRRELHTLVDGVIPVLLTCVLSKSDSAIAAGLYGTSSTNANDPIFSQPIINMGVALERLRSLHKRIPLRDPDRLLQWARGAHNIYQEYINCWRLGFEDVVVNLGPADSNIVEAPQDEEAGAPPRSKEQSGDDPGMPRNADGDVVDAQGRRVDVAYLLKRPLVRLKRLAKTFKGINHQMPSKMAGEQESRFRSLFTRARTKVRDEEARVDDETAAALDSSEAIELLSLAPAPSVTIDPTRYVTLRDMFSLTLRHSSGQTITRRVELFLRDSDSGEGGGDVLVAELRDDGHGLLFAPIDSSLCSARQGGLPGEAVVMVRGTSDDGQERHEILLLYSDHVDACIDWIDALGSNPRPPVIARQQSFIRARQPLSIEPRHDLESVPASRQAVEETRQRIPGDARLSSCHDHDRETRGLSEPSRAGQVEEFEGQNNAINQASSPVLPSSPVPTVKQGRSLTSPHAAGSSQLGAERTFTSLSPQASGGAAMQAGTNQSNGLRRVNAKRASRSFDLSAGTLQDQGAASVGGGNVSPRSELSVASVSSTPREAFLARQDLAVPEFKVPATSTAAAAAAVKPNPRTRLSPDQGRHQDSNSRQDTRLSAASVKSAVLPGGSKQAVQSRSQLSSPQISDPHLEGLDREKIHAPDPDLTRRERASGKKSTSSPPVTPQNTSVGSQSPSNRRNGASRDVTESSGNIDHAGHNTAAHNTHSASNSFLDIPHNPGLTSESTETVEELTPATPPLYAVPAPSRLKNDIKVNAGLQALSPSFRSGSRSSSPLKHEYEPSETSEGSLEDASVAADIQLPDDDDGQDTLSDTTSEEEGEEELEDGDAPTPLIPIGALQRLRKVSRPGSNRTANLPSLAPSDSASQAPYRSVPSQPMEMARAIASVFAWSEGRGLWESVHPTECSIVVTGGLIEVHEMTAEHSAPRATSAASGDRDSMSGSPSVQSERLPLVGQELTPLVMVHRGTALDISIRSPPTARSTLDCGSRIMFRSRNPSECETLYGLVTAARLKNPTYVALQQARCRHVGAGYSALRGRQSQRRKSWLGWGRERSQRGDSVAEPSVSASETSVGTRRSLLSAMRFLDRSGRFFSTPRSNTSCSIASTEPTAPSSGENSGASTPAQESSPGGMNNSIGPAETKCRLHVRADRSKRWHSMGSTRLTIEPSPVLGSGSPGFFPGPIDERRIIVKAKSTGKVFVDACLGSRSFMRVGTCGIAFEVRADICGPTGEVGQAGPMGGTGVQHKIYMISFPSEVQAVYVFSLVAPN